MTDVRICFVISSVGRSDRLERCAAALEAEPADRIVVGFCDQSVGGDAARRFRDRYSGPFFVTQSAPGLSAGRNSVIAAAPEDVTHFAFPNDSSVITEGFTDRLIDRHAHADVVVGRYEDRADTPRYVFDAGERPLDLYNSWRVLEPAMVLSRGMLADVGPFDESIGTGSTGPQSGEGTDILLRYVRSRAIEQQRVHWDPQLVVDGVAQDYGLTRREDLRKRYRYAIGYGALLRRWDYPVWFRLRALVAPLRAAVSGEGLRGLADGVATGTGRARGLTIAPTSKMRGPVRV